MSLLPNLAAALTVMYDPSTYQPADDCDAAHRAREVQEVAKSAERAASEVERGFPLLHYLACVWLWASVEALLEDLVLGALRSGPAMADQEALRDVRVPWTVAASGDPEALARAIYREFEARRGASLRGGVTRFEGLLSAAPRIIETVGRTATDRASQAYGTVARWDLMRPIWVLDLTADVALPSIFDPAKRDQRTGIRFLDAFRDEVSVPVKNGSAGYEYVPKQILDRVRPPCPEDAKRRASCRHCLSKRAKSTGRERCSVRRT